MHCLLKTSEFFKNFALTLFQDHFVNFDFFSQPISKGKYKKTIYHKQRKKVDGGVKNRMLGSK